MSKSARPRKAYKPRVKLNLPIIYGMDPEIRTELAIEPLIAIRLFTSGHGSEELAYALINSILVGYELAENDASRHTFLCGSDALKSVLYRGAQDRWGFSGEELKDVTAAIALSDRLQAVATRWQLRDAVNAVVENAYT